MNYGVVESNVCVNVVVSDNAMESNWIQSDSARIGDIYDPDNETFSTPAAVDQLPQFISRFQFISALKANSHFTPFTNWLNTLDADSDERIYFENESILQRNDVCIESARVALNRTQEQIDTLFIEAASF